MATKITRRKALMSAAALTAISALRARGLSLVAPSRTGTSSVTTAQLGASPHPMPTSHQRVGPASEPYLLLSADPAIVATINVFEVEGNHLEAMTALATDLVKNAELEDDFIAGAVQKAVPNNQQPHGGVSNGHSWVSIYAQWKASGARLGFAGTSENRALLVKASAISKQAGEVLQNPAASLYEHAFFDFAKQGVDPKFRGTTPGGGALIECPSPIGQFINIFNTTPERQHALLEENKKIATPVHRLDGYVSASFHRSCDGKHVANYGQFKTFEDVELMYHNAPIMLSFMKLSLSKVTVPKFSFLGLEFGKPPELHNYSVEYIGKHEAVARS